MAYEAIGSALAETISDATATIEVFTADSESLAASAQRFRATMGFEPEADESA